MGVPFEGSEKIGERKRPDHSKYKRRYKKL